MDKTAKRNLVRALIDILIAAIIGVSLVVIEVASTPFKRGFYCDDESIKYPYKPSTISTGVFLAVSIAIPTFGILLIEGLRYRQAEPTRDPIYVGPCRFHVYIYICYYTIGLFLCGMGVTQQFTDLTKNMVGRLRPHFLTLCNPDFATLNCSGYVEAAVCDSNADPELLKDARKSFMSGHSSVSMYAAIYFVIYLQARLKINRFTYLVKPVVQAWTVLLALYCGLTRISDYKHHWSDVLTGSVFGALVAVITAIYISDLFKGPTMKTITRKLTQLELQKKSDSLSQSTNYGATADASDDKNRSSDAFYM